MIENNSDSSALRGAFLDLFPEECQEKCLVAKASASKAARQVIELETTFAQVSEILAHRFGRCILGPNLVGRCGKKSLCNNELVEQAEGDQEAIEILASL
jgi:hypothetical protein